VFERRRGGSIEKGTTIGVKEIRENRRGRERSIQGEKWDAVYGVEFGWERWRTYYDKSRGKGRAAGDTEFSRRPDLD
jgi:hypothetical protein